MGGARRLAKASPCWGLAEDGAGQRNDAELNRANDSPSLLLVAALWPAPSTETQAFALD